MAYAHLTNNHQILFGNFLGAFEPDIPGKQKISCPDLDKFIGRYHATQEGCEDTEVTLIDKLSLQIEGYRNFIGINTGGYYADIIGNYEGLDLKTTYENNAITELWTTDHDIVGRYMIVLTENSKLTIKVQGEKIDKTCTYVKI